MHNSDLPYRHASISSLASDVSDSEIIKDGWMSKGAVNGENVSWADWRRRYFILTNKELVYYKKVGKEMQQKGSLALCPDTRINQIDKKKFIMKLLMRNQSVPWGKSSSSLMLALEPVCMLAPSWRKST